jgi:hypothetical protein
MIKNFKIGSAISLGMAGLVAFLIIWIYSLKADKAQLEWDLAARDAENDTLKAMGEYAIPDTIWDSIPVPHVVYDTITGEADTSYKKIPWFMLVGSIKIDTIKQLGPHGNRLSIRVAGEFWYPEQYSNRNWLLIHPVAGTPYRPLTARQKSWSVGLNYSRSFGQGDFLGVAVRYKRFTVAPAYDPWGKTVLMTVRFDILGF